MNYMRWNPEQDSQPFDESETADSARKESRLGTVIAGIFFVGLLGSAAFIPLDAGAYAEGIVAVSGNRQAVQHRDGGIVTSLQVEEGQMVRQGAILLTISASEVVAAERGLAGEVVALWAERARLLAERDGLAQVAEPVEFASLSADDRLLADDAMRGQRLLFQARRNSIQAERGVLGQRTRQQLEQIGGYQHQMTSNREQRRLIGEELESLQGLASRGFVSINRIRALERAAAELDGNHGAYRADVARTREAAGEARLQIVSLERQMLEQVATQLREVQVRLDELLPRLAATREQLARAMIRAPASGRVVGLNAFTVGGIVAPGATVMEIVPQDRRLLIEAKAAPTDADDLRVGMTTQIRFSALQERNLPILNGRISNVSADSFEDERTGQRFFRIQVEVPPEELSVIRQFREDGGLRPGLPAEVMVPLRKRTALSYLVEPLTQTLWRAGREH